MDRQRVLRRSFVKTTISSRLKCPICFEVFYKPRRLYCGHTFCKPCLQELFKPHKNPQHINRCPLCRKTIQTKKIGYDFIATKIIDELQVSCPVKGCPWKGENAVLQTHYSFQCKMKDYYNHGSKIRRKVVFQDESYDKEDDVMEKINENIQKGALISRVVSKNPHLLKNIRKEQHELMRQKDGVPRLIDSVTQTRRLKSNHSAREVFRPRRSQLLEEFDYDEAVVIFTPPNAMMKKIASLKKVKNESIIKPKVKKTYADDLNQIERLQKEMGLVADNSDHYLEQQFLSKKVKPLIINLQTKT